jgi:hypothetical protein
MRTDAEFEIWLSEVDLRWKQMFRRATWRMAAVIVVGQASMFAVLMVAIQH